MALRRLLVGGIALVVVAGSAVAIVAQLAPGILPGAPPRMEDILTESVRGADGLSYDVYVPKSFDRSTLHPLVFAASPSGNGRELVPAWKKACDELGFLLVATNNFRNGPYVAKDDALQQETLARVRREYPVDPKRIYAAGFSGGGMHALDLVGDYPNLFRGVITNSGRMPHHFPGNDPFDPAKYPRDKLAVMLASPADVRYAEMQADRELLEAQGWKVKWIEFDGGHVVAPPGAYLEAAEWLAANAN